MTPWFQMKNLDSLLSVCLPLFGYDCILWKKISSFDLQLQRKDHKRNRNCEILWENAVLISFWTPENLVSGKQNISIISQTGREPLRQATTLQFSFLEQLFYYCITVGNIWTFQPFFIALKLRHTHWKVFLTDKETSVWSWTWFSHWYEIKLFINQKFYFINETPH